jgi:hypothetical protein
MAELIDKKSALNALSSASYGNFNYVTARNAIDCIRTTTEAEIRAKALKYAQSRFRNTYETMVVNKMENCINWADMFDSMVADQLKERD